MDRCPNCGAPVRVGAKFCTTCGFRLPEAATDVPPVADVSSTGPAEADAAGRESMAVSPRTDESSDWLAAAASAWPASWEPRPDPNPVSAAASVEAPPPSADEVPEADSTAGGGTIASVETDAAGLTEPSMAASGQARSAGVSLAEQAAQSDLGAADPLATAKALVDELRALLPAVAAGAGSRPGPDVDAVVADLDAARRQPDAARTREFDALRAALEHARAQPRDIDTVLDLVGRVDVVLALQAAHDRYATAIDRAVAALRGAGERRSGGGG